MAQRTPIRSGAVGSGLLTALSTAIMTAAAALIAVLIARFFGRGADTDGFFAAYAVYAVLALGATAVRIAVLPALARARAAGALVPEAGGYALALAVVALPLLVATTAFPDSLAAILTATPQARQTAAEAFVWLGPAAVAQLYAGLAASSLAALDDYRVAALSYALGSIAGLVAILVLAGQGLIAVSYGIALSGAIACVLPVAALLARGRSRALQRPLVRLRVRLLHFLEGVSYPLALHALYLIALRSAGLLGVGSATSFSYAFLIASSLVAVTAFSIVLVGTVPLTRRNLEPELAHLHVVHVTWLSLAPIIGVAGVLALAGEPMLRVLLGDAFAGDVGAELGRLVLYLAPWMALAVGVNVAFPLVFVLGRARPLPLLAAAALAAHVGIDAVGRELLGLAGIALALAVTTSLAFALLLLVFSLPTLRDVAAGIASASLAIGGLAAVAFGVPWLVLDPAAAAVAGAALYVAGLPALRRRGLQAAWDYFRSLH
jgi:hypothetical protein